MLHSNHFIRKFKFTAVIALAVTFMTFAKLLVATPVNNYQDPVVFHTVMGSDKFYNPSGKANLTMHLSPFYQHTHTANKPGENKTTAGNIWGQWNMAGLFLNDQPRSRTQPMPVYEATKTFLRNQATQPASIYAKDYTNESKFYVDEDAFQAVQYQNVNLKYEKMGLRGQVNFDLGVGLGIAVKGGIANLKNRLSYYGLQHKFGTAAEMITSSAAEANSDAATLTDADKTQAKNIYESLMGENARRQLFKELGFDTRENNVTDLEDVYGNVYWHVPIKIREKGEHTFSVIPYISVGASLPMGKERNQNKLYPVINGNDGFTGLTAEGAIALDFPDMMQLSFGGGLTMFNTRDFTGVHVPTSELQSGIYPWTTTISRQPGPLWYANISMKADNIMSKKDIPNFSCYFDYIYAEHRHDTITVKEPSKVFAKYFRPDMLERDSAWKAQMVHAGIKFGLSKNVYLTSAVQATVGGSRTYRPTTLLGGLIMSF